MNLDLLRKYNVAGPRYTSYPTVPYWNDKEFYLKRYKETIIKSFRESNASQGISLYIHLPFCESLCTFCGCNKRITKNHGMEIPYLESVLKEWRLYQELFHERPIIKELHLGGGTPTFFSAENLEFLITEILRTAKKAENAEFSFEAHPNNTSEEHLKTLVKLGFNRLSYGVQDYNEKVQLAINRIQPFDQVKTATSLARKAGFESVGHDIIFGLPFQTLEHIEDTISKTVELKPDRIAFYSYAHVPWIKGNGQRGFKEQDLPTAAEKRQQYEIGKKSLIQAGYVEIGMDHFALPTDNLYASMKTGNIHRNFMGYTASKTQLMIGLGVSAIGDSWYGFGQNVKGVEEYQNLLENNILPVFRGHILNSEDLIVRKHILNIMCRLETKDLKKDFDENTYHQLKSSLQELEEDGLIELTEDHLLVTETGRPFVRNIAMAFDLRLLRKKPETKLFSMTI